MPDILIRGMEMPKEGGKILIAAGGSVWVNAWPTRGYMRMENVYAVPLPEGHGKLIDIKDVKSGKFHIEGRAEMYSAYNTGWNDALDAVCMNAPSIVPAEGGSADGNP